MSRIPSRPSPVLLSTSIYRFSPYLPNNSPKYFYISIPNISYPGLLVLKPAIVKDGIEKDYFLFIFIYLEFFIVKKEVSSVSNDFKFPMRFLAFSKELFRSKSIPITQIQF